MPEAVRGSDENLYWNVIAQVVEPPTTALTARSRHDGCVLEVEGDLFERIDVDSREQRAVAVWKAASDAGVNRSDSVTEWLRRQDSNLRPSG
jgi:hypothetical protein